MTSDVGFLIYVAVDCNSHVSGKYYHHIKIKDKTQEEDKFSDYFCHYCHGNCCRIQFT